MAKNNGNDHFLSFTSRLISFCFVMPICYAITAVDPVVESVTPIINYGDSPVFRDGSVYFLDTFLKQLVRYIPDTDPVVGVSPSTIIVKLGIETVRLRFLVPIDTDNSTFAIGYGGSIGVFKWDGNPTNNTIMAEYFLSAALGLGESVTCGKGDPSGRLWIGTTYPINGSEMAGRRGRMYLMDSSGTSTNKIEDLSVPYAIDWSPDGKVFYYLNAIGRAIVAHTFDNKEGTIVNDGQTIFEFPSDVDGVPGGMTVDMAGNLWVSCMNGSQVLKIDPATKTLVTKVKIPGVTSITSVAFGGATFEDLYVTTVTAPLFEVTKTGSKGSSTVAVDINPPPGGSLQNIGGDDGNPGLA